jgi:hydroxyacylglutathione hydrolase
MCCTMQMHTALCVYVASLPRDTLVYCGHEYTVANLRFAAAVDPSNEAIKSKAAWAAAQVAAGLHTVPSTGARCVDPVPALHVILTAS